MKTIQLKISFILISVSILGFSLFCPSVFGQYGGTLPPPSSTPSYNGNISYRIVNLTSPWNFMGSMWQGYSEAAALPPPTPTPPAPTPSTPPEFPYPYWDYEKQYLLAQVRILEKKGVNTIRIMLVRPWEICQWSIVNLQDTDVRSYWWSNSQGYRGTINQGMLPSDFQNPDYINWSSNLDDLHNLENINRCWDRLFEFLEEMKEHFPNVNIILCFYLGLDIRGPLPAEKEFSNQSGPFYQSFDHYYTGTNWLYFKTFYNKCKEYAGAQSINEYMESANVDFVEIHNEGDQNCLKYDVESAYLYSQPWDEEAIPEYYYETNAQIAEAIEDEQNEKMSREKFRNLIDWAGDVIINSDYLGVSGSKLSYGFTHAETMKLLLYNNNSYILPNLSWHMYGDLFLIGLGPKVDWLRSSMKNFSNINYNILLGEIGHCHDYQLSYFAFNTETQEYDWTPYEPFTGTDQSIYNAYDSTSEYTKYYIKTWLQEAEYFSQNARENIWGPVGEQVCPLTGTGLWCSSDSHVIDDYSSHIFRWGLFETFDTPYRKPENWLPSNPDGYRYSYRTKRNIIAPISRYSLMAVSDCWVNNHTGIYPEDWRSGDLVNQPFRISCPLDGSIELAPDLSAYSFSYGSSSEDDPNALPEISIIPYDGVDIWFRTKYYYNIHGQVKYQFLVFNIWHWVMPAIFYKTESETTWHEGDCYQNYCWTVAEWEVPPDIQENLDILLYFWTDIPDPNSDYSLNLFLVPVIPPDPKE
ncbi:hypothetical protein JW926_15260 [Candidatus Sumerlaeota bacterium]|nr:hypothetical protein [Candidatus Sumerlaeota bacterium]